MSWELYWGEKKIGNMLEIDNFENYSYNNFGVFWGFGHPNGAPMPQDHVSNPLPEHIDLG